MKRIFTIISLGLLMTSLSCTKEQAELGRGEGTLSLSMSLEGQTRSVSEDELRNSAQVKIYKADFSGLVRSYTYSDMPSAISLVADEYRVDVQAGESV